MYGQVRVNPNPDRLPGGAQIQQILDGLAGWALLAALGGLLISVIVWSMGSFGGNFHAVNSSSGAGGAYQIMPSTWRLYGQTGLPENASPALQSQVAAQIWNDSGPAAWQCAGMVGIH